MGFILNLRNKVLLSTFFISISMLFSIFYFADKYFYSNYTAIEDKEIIDSVKSVKGLLNKYEDMINNANGDWSAWDDMYRFIQDQNEDFINSNLQKENFISLSTNFMIFVNEQGKVIYSKGYDLYNGEEISPPLNLIKYIESNDEINKHSDLKSRKSGFVSVDKDMFVLSSMPIKKSSFEGPIKGTLILARIITDNEIAYINKFSSDKVNLEQITDNSYNELKSLRLYSERNEEVYLKNINKNTFLVKSVINDISGKPALILSVNFPRDVYIISSQGETVFLVITAVIILFSVIITIYLLERYVFRILLQQESLLNTIPAMVYYKDRNFKYIMANNVFCENFKVDQSSIKGKEYEEIDNKIYIEENKNIELQVQKSLKPVLDVEVTHVNEEGNTQWFSLSKAPVLDSKGNFNGIVGIMVDITNVKEMSNKLDIASYYDSLTMLPNRELFMRSLSEFIKKYEEEKSCFSVLYIGVDNFALINEVMGHQAGDELLRVVAQRITRNVKAGSFVSRISGDEFAVILNESDNELIDNSCDYILHSIRRPWKYGTEIHYITISIGISKYPYDGYNCDEIIKSSYTAMKLAKVKGKNTFVYYSKKFSEDFMKKLNIENNLRLALKRNEFVLYYQPQVRIDDMRVIGAEALIRWIHPESGLISPGIFIPIAEESDIILQIGEWVINESCRQIREWRDKGIDNIKISINVSAKQFQQDDLEDILKNAIIKNSIDPSYLEIEITESLFMNNRETVREKLFRIKNMGINILLDDFGTGYSSLLYLSSFPIDKIKIDQNFVRDMLKNKDNNAIIKTIVTLSSQLGIKTIAEGVEEEQQYNNLKELGCDEIQGYLFGKPSKAADIEEMFKAKYHSKFGI